MRSDPAVVGQFRLLRREGRNTQRVVGGERNRGEPETDQGPADLDPGERVRQGRRTPGFRAEQGELRNRSGERPNHGWFGLVPERSRIAERRGEAKKGGARRLRFECNHGRDGTRRPSCERSPRHAASPRMAKPGLAQRNRTVQQAKWSEIKRWYSSPFFNSILKYCQTDPLPDFKGQAWP